MNIYGTKETINMYKHPGIAKKRIKLQICKLNKRTPLENGA